MERGKTKEKRSQEGEPKARMCASRLVCGVSYFY